MSERVAAQIIVPAYVYADDKQRTALLLRLLDNLEQLAHANNSKPIGPLQDAEVRLTHVGAVIGTAPVNGEAVDFVAYEQCDAADADLVIVHVSIAIGPDVTQNV
jgi:hypothetical protein